MLAEVKEDINGEEPDSVDKKRKEENREGRDQNTKEQNGWDQNTKEQNE